ncbi:ISKra4 family transposase [Gordonia rhizosphera]|nr:ISKra4 family transposase [Gordonia rhizosphera]
MTQIGASLLEQLLGADGGYRGPRIDCRGGHRARFVGYRDKTITTVLGAVEVRRGYYHCADCGHGVVPRDDELGVSGVSLSPGLRKITAVAAAAAPFAAASVLLAELAGIRLGTKRIERSAETDGAAAADRQAVESAAICRRAVQVLAPSTERPAPDKLYIAIDGTGVPMTAAAVAGRTGKAADGRAHTREVKLAAVFTQTTIDDEGRPLRDPDSTSYVASFATSGDFAPLAAAEATRRGAEQTRQLVVLGDGAAWIWNLATATWPEATPIVDLYHAREHLHALADQLADTLGADRSHWLEQRLADLDDGDIETLVTATQTLLPTLDPALAATTDKALGYFITNAQRMRYGYFRDHGFFVGSGVVEAGCKSIIGARLKQSGMRWNITGATGIITLRCHQASNRLDNIWTHPHNQTATA